MLIRDFQAGLTVCEALRDFLIRLEIRTGVYKPGSSLGNAWKDVLLWVVYQLVQPGGALSARRGPLDVQHKFITLLTYLKFTNTDLETAMSVTECVGVLVFTYVRGSGGNYSRYLKLREYPCTSFTNCFFL